MRKILLQAVGLLFFGSLVVQEAAAGAGEPMVTAEFNTFVFGAAGPIQNLGPGEFLQSSQLSTTFDIAGGMVGNFSLDLVFTGPGAFDPDPIPMDSMLCIANDTVSHCTVNEMFNFEAAMIVPGDIFTANGAVVYDGTSLATAMDSFVASAPEPAAFALIVAGLFGIALTRRRTAR